MNFRDFNKNEIFFQNFEKYNRLILNTINENKYYFNETKFEQREKSKLSLL